MKNKYVGLIFNLFHKDLKKNCNRNDSTDTLPTINHRYIFKTFIIIKETFYSKYAVIVHATSVKIKVTSDKYINFWRYFQLFL